MPDHHTIYDQHPGEYEDLVSREDYQGNILPAIEKIHPLKGAAVVELGAGTGRLTRLLAPHVRSITAYDGAQAMLDHGRPLLDELGITNVDLAVADHRELPAPDGEADLVLSGWSMSYFATWQVPDWRAETRKALEQMRRVLKPGGTMLLLETLGTGSEVPIIPSPELEEFYRFLEEEEGFRRSWIRTDYRFDSVEEAERIAGYFFGEPMARKVRENGWSILPECTGLWTRKK